MNHRHIQTFLTVSAAFLALNAPLPANASTQRAVNARVSATQSVEAAGAATVAAKAERRS
jgi:hypothetical protein